MQKSLLRLKKKARATRATLPEDYLNEQKTYLGRDDR